MTERPCALITGASSESALSRPTVSPSPRSARGLSYASLSPPAQHANSARFARSCGVGVPSGSTSRSNLA